MDIKLRQVTKEHDLPVTKQGSVNFQAIIIDPEVSPWIDVKAVAYPVGCIHDNGLIYIRDDHVFGGCRHMAQRPVA
jgi:hypothetical protein